MEEYEELREEHYAGQEERHYLTFEKACAKGRKIDFQKRPPAPPPLKPGITVVTGNYALDDVLDYMDWNPFFQVILFFVISQLGVGSLLPSPGLIDVLHASAVCRLKEVHYVVLYCSNVPEQALFCPSFPCTYIAPTQLGLRAAKLCPFFPPYVAPCARRSFSPCASANPPLFFLSSAITPPKKARFSPHGESTSMPFVFTRRCACITTADVRHHF